MIRLEKLSKRFKRLKVLDALDLTIEPGERIALVGSNGAGKTTMIRCILGEYTHDGQVQVADEPAAFAAEGKLGIAGRHFLLADGALHSVDATRGARLTNAAGRHLPGRLGGISM